MFVDNALKHVFAEGVLGEETTCPWGNLFWPGILFLNPRVEGENGQGDHY
jgi:hypothetical protein